MLALDVGLAAGEAVSFEDHLRNARDMTVADGRVSWTHQDVTIQINGATIEGADYTIGRERRRASFVPLGTYTADGSVRIMRKSWRKLVRWASRGAANAVWLGRIGGRRAFARDLRGLRCS